MAKASKIRLDQLLVDRQLVDSRAQAQALILAHKVMDENGQLLTKAGQQVAIDQPLRLKEKEHPWVSRGGMKLAKAIEHFGLQPAGMICVDVGASTGGFTDVLLQHHAQKVYAIDVGYGQLHEKLRQDSRVINREKTNARYLSADDFDETPDAFVCDASFISLKVVLPSIMEAIRPEGWMVALIKPQFEVGKEKVGKGGVVKDPQLHQQTCDDIRNWVKEQSWQVQGTIQSPITGPKGNVEFLIYAVKQ